VLCSWHTVRRLGRKLRHDRFVMRGSALAYETLLSVVPLTAVGMGAVRIFGGSELQNDLMRYLAAQYVPESANAAVEQLIGLVERLDLSTIGLVGLVALVPVMYSLVDAVELSLSDIFRTPRRTHWWLLLLLGSALTLAPLGSVLTVRYIPWHALAYDHVLTPLLLVTGMLYGVFRLLPSVRISHRAALVGALSTGILLSIAKVGFGLYATHLALGLHKLWGAIAFVPLLLVWVLLSWSMVLLGAEISAVVQLELASLELQSHTARMPTTMRERSLRRQRQRKRKIRAAAARARRGERS
jgi:membrane protein